MAWYKNSDFLKHSTVDAYDKDHGPGNAAQYAGIYRCMGCGREIGIASGHTLPPQNNHQHTDAQGHVRWRLIVWADHRPAGEQK